MGKLLIQFLILILRSEMAISRGSQMPTFNRLFWRWWEPMLGECYWTDGRQQILVILTDLCSLLRCVLHE